jgi:hypothetical protein
MQLAPLVLVLVLAAGCFTHTVNTAPIEIKPIHITMDINLRVQRELDSFFDFEEATPATATVPRDPDKE